MSYFFKTCYNGHVVLGTVVYIVLGVIGNLPLQSFRYEDVLALQKDSVSVCMSQRCLWWVSKRSTLTLSEGDLMSFHWSLFMSIDVTVALWVFSICFGCVYPQMLRKPPFNNLAEDSSQETFLCKLMGIFFSTLRVSIGTAVMSYCQIISCIITPLSIRMTVVERSCWPIILDFHALQITGRCRIQQ